MLLRRLRWSRLSVGTGSRGRRRDYEIPGYISVVTRDVMVEMRLKQRNRKMPT